MKHHECHTHGDHQCCCSSHSHSGNCCHEHHSHDCQEGHDHQDFAHRLIELADHAWMEVLQEKIKEQIIQTHGKHLDELAKLVADSNHERWNYKMAVDKSCKSFKERLKDFFNSK
jgi:hypothetical protein